MKEGETNCKITKKKKKREGADKRRKTQREEMGERGKES